MQQRSAAEAIRLAAEARRYQVLEIELSAEQLANAMQSFLEGNITARQELEEQSKQSNPFADLMPAHSLRYGYSGILVDVTQAEADHGKVTVARPWIDRFADTDNDYAVLWKAIRLE